MGVEEGCVGLFLTWIGYLCGISGHSLALRSAIHPCENIESLGCVQSSKVRRRGQGFENRSVDRFEESAESEDSRLFCRNSA